MNGGTGETTLNILWLWPDILNLHGDRGNVMALTRFCGLLGIEANVTRVNRLTDDFDFDTADFALLGPGELAVIGDVVRALSEKRGALADFAARGGVLFVTGTTGAVLAKETIRTDGSVVRGLALLDMVCGEREKILGDDLIFCAGAGMIADGADENVVCGIQIQMMDTFLAAGQAPFGKVLYGHGNNGGEADEGARRGNIIFTNALGPALVKNPWLTLDLIECAIRRKNPAFSADAFRADIGNFELERASAAAIRRFNAGKQTVKK